MVDQHQPKFGDIFGFDFIYPPKTHTERHPGLVIGVKQESESRYWCLVLSISHHKPKDRFLSIKIPPGERAQMGLDAADQWVSCEYYYKMLLPTEVRVIASLGKMCIGQASARFMTEVTEMVRQHRGYMKQVNLNR